MAVRLQGAIFKKCDISAHKPESNKACAAGTCERTLGMVEESYSRGPRSNDPDWVYWLNREEIDVMAGRCYTELRQPGRAVSLLTDAISRYDPAYVRENSLYLSWLAED